MPPSHLEHYVADNLPPDGELPGCTLQAFLGAVLPFRNMGMGHQAEESWFPRDRRMYALVRAYLDPSVDELLTWAPMRELLRRYEIVKVEGAPLPVAGARLSYPISRPRVADGVAALGGSRLLAAGQTRLDVGTPFIARRCEQVDQLDGLVRLVRFPSPLQSSELLTRRYATVYLRAYLDHGLITPTQRQTTLAPTSATLALRERDKRHVEGEIQYAINLHSSDNPAQADKARERLETLVGPTWSTLADEVAVSLEELPTRRKDYIYELIENNTIMSFAELRGESELSEPDLDTVLAELEDELRVRQINAGVQGDRLVGYFKVQDPSRLGQLRALLDGLRAQKGRRKGYPAPIRELVELCVELLADDGLSLGERELDSYSDLYLDDSEVRVVAEDEGSDMILRVGDDELRGRSVRDLLTQVWELVIARGVDTSAVVPMLMGKTRYLVARTPAHANGTPFTIPIEVGEVVFEGNLKRNQALAEAIRLLRRLGLDASSPEIQPPREDEVDEDEDEVASSEASAVIDGDDGDRKRSELMIEITAPGADAPTRIEGPTVRRFFIALMDFLVRHDAALSEVVPVATGRVRYFMAEEPYHANARPFHSMIERDGYFLNTAYSYVQALNAAKILLDKLGWPAKVQGVSSDDDATPLKVEIAGETVEARSVPSFFTVVFEKMFELGVLGPGDVPYKSGRVRYLISETPIHDHGREFIRPLEIEVDGRCYFVESNVSRQGALDLVERLIASKQDKIQTEDD